MPTVTSNSSTVRSPSAGGSIGECIDEIDHFIQGLDRYPEQVIAVSLRAHLAILLQALVATDSFTPHQVRNFVRALEVDALGTQDLAVS